MKPTLLAVSLFAAFCGLPAAAQSPSPSEPLRETVGKALAANPEVAARLNALRAADEAIQVSRGGWLPRLDLQAGVGRDRDTIDSRNPQTQTLNRTGASLTLSQLLWDGLATRNEVGRLGHERMARYFDLLEVTEQTALEAARAHYDVLRFRRLVQLAEDNYVQHRYAFLQIQSRVRAGVGRGVDLEQATARLALAESNLATEVANLHDVSARFQRIVGELPAPALAGPARLAGNVPPSADEAAQAAVRSSAAISASIETLRAARSAASVRDSAFQPRVEARLRAGGGTNYEGVLDRTRAATGEVVLAWNLFNGGSDQARVRQQAAVLDQATDLRDKACRDVRQTAAIAFNDTGKYAEQITLLERNTQAIEKARDAYRQQFDIGQRSLLDLLNAENEVYTARRSLANARFDLDVAFVRTHASLSQLTTQLGIARRDAGTDAAGWSAADDGPGRCAMDAARVAATPRSELDARAQRIADAVPTPAASPAAAAPTRP